MVRIQVSAVPAYHLVLALLALAFGALASNTASAQAIYPADRTEILVGARFDFKVEFAKAPPEADVTVTINGRSPQEVFGATSNLVVNEDNWGNSALWLRNVELPKVGRYVVEARSSSGTATATWEVFTTKPQAAKNVILFIGDGM